MEGEEDSAVPGEEQAEEDSLLSAEDEDEEEEEEEEEEPLYQGLPPPVSQNWVTPILDLSSARLSSWNSWRDRWEDYKVVSQLDNKPIDYQCSVLRYTFTDETRRIYRTLKLSNEERNDPDKIVAALETYATGIVNETLERHKFNNRCQGKDESFDDFLTSLKDLSKSCNFCERCHDGLIRDRVVAGIQNDKTRRTLLGTRQLTLPVAEEICRSEEKALEGMEELKKGGGGEGGGSGKGKNKKKWWNPFSK